MKRVSGAERIQELTDRGYGPYPTAEKAVVEKFLADARAATPEQIEKVYLQMLGRARSSLLHQHELQEVATLAVIVDSLAEMISPARLDEIAPRFSKWQ